jgi:hypothetical protein
MAILNHITLEALVRLPVSEIISLPAEELARLQQEADLALRKARATVAWLDGALIARYGARAAGARAEDGKDFGIVRFSDGVITVVAELPKRVDWDQHELSALVERIKADGEDPREYVDVILKVPERKYAAWPRHIAKIFEPARTVQAGSQSFRLTTDAHGDA